MWVVFARAALVVGECAAGERLRRPLFCNFKGASGGAGDGLLLLLLQRHLGVGSALLQLGGGCLRCRSGRREQRLGFVEFLQLMGGCVRCRSGRGD